MTYKVEVASRLEITHEVEVASRSEGTYNVSVIICAYTEERWSNLIAAVVSIQQQSTAPREIIVVIDYNKSLFERASAEFSDVQVIENSEPKGLSGARNSGITVAQGTLIAFLDDDAVAEPDWLELLCDRCKDTQVLGVGGVVEPLWSVKRPLWFPAEFYWVVGCSYQILSDQPTVVRNPYGGCFCIRRSVFEGVGGFRNGIGRIDTHPMGGEETELCIRATQHWPHRIFLSEPRAKIHHHISPHRASWSYFRSRCYAEGLSKALVAKYVGVKDSLASEHTYTFQTLPKAVVSGAKDALFKFDMTGLLRAGAIIAGFTITTAGYLVGSMFSQIPQSRKAMPEKKLFGATPEYQDYTLRHGGLVD